MREKTATVIESELYARISLITGHSKDTCRTIIKTLAEFVCDEIKDGTPVRIGPLGEITTLTCKRCGGYDWKTHQTKPTKTVRLIKFKPSASLKRAVKSQDLS